MKAIAKHDCDVTLYVDLNALSLNRMAVRKGQVFDLPVHSDKKLTGIIAEKLGERCVTFVDKMWLIPTYSRDFEYVE